MFLEISEPLISWVPAAIAAGGILGGSILSSLGQDRANKANKDIAYHQTAASDRMADKQMKFQELMSSSAHQRQVKDLKAAGLNPLLAATGGASSPAGASGEAAGAHMQNIAEGLGSSARDAINATLQTKRLGEEVKNMKSNRRKMDMETKVMSKGIPEAEVKNKVFERIIEPILDKIDSGFRTRAKEKPKRLQQMKKAKEKMNKKNIPINKGYYLP